MFVYVCRKSKLCAINTTCSTRARKLVDTYWDGSNRCFILKRHLRIRQLLEHIVCGIVGQNVFSKDFWNQFLQIFVAVSFLNSMFTNRIYQSTTGILSILFQVAVNKPVKEFAFLITFHILSTPLLILSSVQILLVLKDEEFVKYLFLLSKIQLREFINYPFHVNFLYTDLCVELSSLK